MAFEQITYEKRGKVGLVTLNRPEKLNAWTYTMMGEIRQAMNEANADDGVGAIVFTGAGRAFCAGADISATFQTQIDSNHARPANASASDNWVQAVQENPKPTIAAINGAAVGIGITLILPFDIRIASTEARIGMFFVRMGLVPELASSHLLPQLVGSGRALEWCLTGRMIPADEAREAGLVTEVLPADQLLDRALALGEQLSNQSQPAMSMIKSLLRENANETDIAEVSRREGTALGEAYRSWQHKEAVAAFLGKRAPDFSKKP